ncbi:MAG: type II secretion system protein GspC [Pseudomonadota bacterium]
MNIAPAIDRLRQTPPEQLLLQGSKVLPPWIALVLAVAAAWNLGQIVWLLIPQPDTGTVAPPPSASAATPLARPTATPNSDSVERIVRAHLFGEFNAEATPVVVQGPSEGELAEDTSLQLLGVLADEGGNAGQAVIVNPRKQAAVYRVGDRVEGVQAEVDGIYAQWVRINKNGQFTKLSLPEAAKLAGAAPAPVSRRSAIRRPTRSRAQNQAVQSLVDAAAAGELKLSDLLRPQPVFDSGELVGYRVYPGKDRQAFARLGLRPGDLVTQINGASLDNPNRGFEIFKQLEGQVPIAVTVERNGSTETIVLDPGQAGISGS